MPRRMRTPGPGWLNMSVAPSEASTAAFMSTSQRRDLARHNGGDPGAYDPSACGPKASLGMTSRQSYNRNATGGSASFNSRSPARAISAPPRSARGGPGEHDYTHLYACGNASTRVTSAFKSSVPLGAHVRKIDTPGAGTYDPNDGSQSTLSKDGGILDQPTAARLRFLRTTRRRLRVRRLSDGGRRRQISVWVGVS